MPPRILRFHRFSEGFFLVVIKTKQKTRERKKEKESLDI